MNYSNRFSWTLYCHNLVLIHQWLPFDMLHIVVMLFQDQHSLSLKQIKTHFNINVSFMQGKVSPMCNEHRVQHESPCTWQAVTRVAYTINLELFTILVLDLPLQLNAANDLSTSKRWTAWLATCTRTRLRDGHPSKYGPRSTLLNFGASMRTHVQCQVGPFMQEQGQNKRRRLPFSLVRNQNCRYCWHSIKSSPDPRYNLSVSGGRF